MAWLGGSPEENKLALHLSSSLTTIPQAYFLQKTTTEDPSTHHAHQTRLADSKPHRHYNDHKNISPHWHRPTPPPTRPTAPVGSAALIIHLHLSPSAASKVSLVHQFNKTTITLRI